jgi:hypothetical protein
VNKTNLTQELGQLQLEAILRLIDSKIIGSSLLGMIRSGGINRLNPYRARDSID